MKKQIAVALMIPALLFGTVSSGQDVTEAAGYRSSTIVPSALKVIQAGKKYMGTPYLFGSDRSPTW